MNFKEIGWNPVPFKQVMNHAVMTNIVSIISEHLSSQIKMEISFVVHMGFCFLEKSN